MSRVVLVGCSGVGCTTVGTLVAQRLGWPFLDDDAVLERTAGADARTLHLRDGAAGLLAAQVSALNLLLAVPGPLVATVPSVLLLDAPSRERLQAGGHLVWLRASAATLVRRVGRDRDRPWLGDDPAAALQHLVDEHDPVGAAAADQVVDADVAGAGQLARALLAALPSGVLPERRAVPR